MKDRRFLPLSTILAGGAVVVFAVSGNSDAPSFQEVRTLTRGNQAHPPADFAVPATSSRDTEQHIPFVIVDESSSLTYQFPIINDSEGPLEFAEVQPSCGCTHAKLDEMRVEPRQATTLTLSINLAGRMGPQRFTCRLRTSTNEARVYALTTLAYPRVQFSESVIHFGLVDPGASLTKQFAFLAYGTTQEALPTDFTVEAQGQGVKIVQGNAATSQTTEGVYCRRIPVEVRLTAPNRPGSGSVTVITRYKSSGNTQSSMISADWRVRQDIQPSPEVVFFDSGARKSGESVSRRVILKSTDGRKLTVTRIQVPHSAISATHNNSDNLIVLTLTLDPKQLSACSAGDLVVSVAEYREPVRIPVAVAPE